MILFTALLPPEDVVTALEAELARQGVDQALRWSSPSNWHVTLAYYGDVPEIPDLALSGRPAPRLWIEGAGTFPGVLWLNVAGEELAELASAAGAGADGRKYRSHLTLARYAKEDPDAGKAWAERLMAFRTEPWVAREAVLMRSDRDERGTTYRVVERYPLNG
ncbi:RNA 2',3'-cyclic phosphodiesterase [Amycolatopsis sp. NPDC059657]|uniref:RNA 2',3'-cyclic phosphodiesterase n=1 Tax=Amycolatopsis sp. NPDC059657 TaxID=3346899 RepID=UPI00367168C5